MLQVSEPIWDKIAREVDLFSSGIAEIPTTAKEAVVDHPLLTGGQFVFGGGLAVSMQYAANSHGWLKVTGRVGGIGLGLAAAYQLGTYLNNTSRAASDTWQSPVHLEEHRTQIKASLAPLVVESAVMFAGASLGSRLYKQWGPLETRLPRPSGDGLQSVPLPAFTADGFLPPGIHKAAWPEFVQRFGATPRRQELLKGMEFLMRELAKHEGGDRVFVGGSVVTNKAAPGDFDMTWRVSGEQLGILQKKSRILTDRTLQKETLQGQLMATYPNSPNDGILGFLQLSRANRPIGVVEIELSSLPPQYLPPFWRRATNRLMDYVPAMLRISPEGKK